MARFRSRIRKTPVDSIFTFGEVVRVTLELDKKFDAPIKALLENTGEPFAEDALRVVLTTCAASDNQAVFQTSERARALIGTFRDAISILAREAAENFRIETERQLNEFINTIHATEEEQ